ncbi:hypothetical protein U8527_07130 [Kordia algicida OT-1]|uniref:Uncharacterized protein n=1 Tax=Kordia algicida OT-1 TaxID=391587 RepID=A9E9A2_9FLAO|nr:hypothetical protein [Kordia algicida]EDP94653.1 hypothetical protein KAOT1_00215 [Kordia algicida OT-1]EDP94717.1 hypothetical protein KAOT1_00535 [Kordia algicida OT-1]
MEKNNKNIDQAVIHKMMNRAIEINHSCKEKCRDFKIMTSTMRKDSLILQWRTIDISNEDNPIQYYRFECFKMDGTPELCSIHYTDQKQANDFITSLQTLYHQKFAIDHTL